MKPLTGAFAVSSWGDYIARIGVATAVLERTGSALLAAAVFAVSLLPTLIGRAGFGPVADRYPYRTIVLAADLIRVCLAIVVALAVFLHGSTVLLLALLFVLELAGGPVVTAQSAMILEFLPDPRYYNRAAAVNETMDQTNQALGLAVGGIIAALFGPTSALLLDAATFLLTAFTVWRVIAPRPRREEGAPETSGYLRDLAEGARYLRGHRLLSAMLLLMLAAIAAGTAPEASGLAYARDQLGSLRLGGLLMATPIVGMIAGLLVVSHWDGVTQIQRVRPMALLMPLPLLLTAVWPSLYTALPLFFAVGVLSAFILPLQATFLPLIDEAFRGRVYGIASALTVCASGLAYLAVGALASIYSPATAVSLCGLVSLVLIAAVLIRWPSKDLTAAARRIYRG